MATVLTGCQNMDSNGLLSSGAEAFSGLYVKRCAGKALSDQSVKARQQRNRAGEQQIR